MAPRGVVTGRGEDCGYTFLAGSFTQMVTLGNWSLRSNVMNEKGKPKADVHSDMFVVKLDPRGSVVWVMKGGGTGAEEVKGKSRHD